MVENNLGIRIETNRLVLRDLRRGDEASIVENANSLSISQYMTLLPYPYNLSDAEWFVNKNIPQSAQSVDERTNFDFAVTFRDEDVLMGVIGLSKIDRFEGTGTVGYWLGERFWRRGIMGEAARAVIDFAFSRINLRRIDISAVPDNTASNVLIRSLGFSYEGTRRQRHRSKATGRVHDINEYGLLREDWIKMRGEKEKNQK